MNLNFASRRAALMYGVAALVAPSIARAESKCSLAGPLGDEVCITGLNIGNDETARQQRPHWCWAACVQTIFALHGYDVSQDAIVDKVFGREIDRSANAAQIMSAINGKWTCGRGGCFQANGEILWDHVASFERPDALQLAAGELDKGNPLIFATEGHSMVLTAMSYERNAKGRLAIKSLTVRDPWPGAPNRRRLSEEEIQNSGLLCAVHVAAA